MTTALLLSGGMDSISIAYWMRPEIAVTVDYGQVPAAAELRAAAAVARELGIEHLTVNCDLAGLGSGDLAGRAALAVASRPEWWPYRNQFLVTVGAMAALPRGARRLLIGTLATDAHHGDGSPDFVGRMDDLLSRQEGGMRLDAPALALSGPDLVRVSGVPVEILSWAHSCHRANQACGSCGGCSKHYRTMAALGVAPF